MTKNCVPTIESRPLKLLVITMMYDPDCVGIAAVASDMCSTLAARGHDVTVYTTYPYYPEWKLKADAKGWRVHEELIDGVQVRRHRIYVPSKPSRLISRLLHELSFPFSMLKSFFHGRNFDVIMVFCPLMGGVAFATLRKLVRRDPLWINIQDIPVEAAAASGMIKSKGLARLASFVQRLVFSRGDIWSSISPEMIEQLETIRKDKKTPIHLCPNWLTSSLHERIIQLSNKVGRIPRSSPQLLYCGTIGNKQGLLEFCQRLSSCSSDFCFKIRGAGSEAQAVQNWLENCGDHRFDFAALLPESNFVSAIHEADWFVIPQKSSVGCSFFPSKLIPSISIGTPILAISEPEGPLGREVVDHGLGLVVPWSNVERLTFELDAFRKDTDAFETFQNNCRHRAAAYQRDFAIDRIERHLNDLRERNREQRVQPMRRHARTNGQVPTA